ncbi:hypothetical protein ACFLQI_00265 [Candidatus Undinarchaeota archaeon]
MSGAYQLSVNIFNSDDMGRLKKIIDQNMPKKEDPKMNFNLKSGKNKIIFELTVDPDSPDNEKKLKKVAKGIIDQAKDEHLKFSSEWKE